MPHATKNYHTHAHTHTHTHQVAGGSDSVCVVSGNNWKAVIGPIPASDCASWGGQSMSKSQYASSCSQLGSNVKGYHIVNPGPNQCFVGGTQGSSVLGVLDQNGGMCSTRSDVQGGNFCW